MNRFFVSVFHVISQLYTKIIDWMIVKEDPYEYMLMGFAPDPNPPAAQINVLATILRVLMVFIIPIIGVIVIIRRRLNKAKRDKNNFPES